MMIAKAPIVGLSLAACITVADQATKAWALNGWFFPPRTIEVTSFFNLVAVWNSGVSFGLLANHSEAMPYILTGFAIVVSLGLTVWLLRVQSRLLEVGLGLVIGGALGNVIDRLRFQAVVDFIDLHAAGYHWPAFNVADAAVTIGVSLLLLDSFSRRGEP
jgi:signal peptidase II